jgi:hypothetical protein
MTPPPDAWLLLIGLALLAAFFVLLAVSGRPGVDSNRPIYQYKFFRLAGLGGAALLALFALGRSDAVMGLGLAFFAALLVIRPPAPGSQGQDRAGRDDRP